MKVIIFLFFSFLALADLKAQVLTIPDSVNFTGVVFHAETGKPMPDVTCRIVGGKGTMSDERGCFRLMLHRNDTVMFTYVGFRPCRIVVPDTLTAPDYMVGVFMNTDTLKLSEVIIVRRFSSIRQQQLIRAHNNMRGILRQAYNPDGTMDAEMNQRMMINEFARALEMKGHVDVGFGVGTQSLDVLSRLKMQKNIKERQQWLNTGETDLLKKIYYAEKAKKITE